MSCSCNRVIDTSKHGLQYSLAVPGTTNVMGTPIERPLFPPAKVPRGGWRFTLMLMGQEHLIRGSNPYDVAAEAARLLTLNEILYTPTQLWLNLNIQWVGRAVEKYQVIKLTDLLAISRPNF